MKALGFRGRGSGVGLVVSGLAWAGAPRPTVTGRRGAWGGLPAVSAPAALGTRLLLRAAAGQGKPAELRRRQKGAKKATGRATRWRKESGAPLSCLPLTRLPLLTLVSPFVRGS